MEQRLDELEPGRKARVLRVEGDAALRHRIMDMGLVPGTEVRLERSAPLTDPVSFRVRGFELAQLLHALVDCLVTALGGQRAAHQTTPQQVETFIPELLLMSCCCFLSASLHYRCTVYPY